MNKTLLIGRLTKDPDVRYINADKAVAKFNIAVNRNEGVDYIPCTAFGKTAENIEKYFTKGKQIGITGHLNSGSYETSEGKRIYTLDVIVESFDFIGKKEDGFTEDKDDNPF